jgi:FtsZ-interacting cell division protein YlmF
LILTCSFSEYISPFILFQEKDPTNDNCNERDKVRERERERERERKKERKKERERERKREREKERKRKSEVLSGRSSLAQEGEVVSFFESNFRYRQEAIQFH